MPRLNTYDRDKLEQGIVGHVLVDTSQDMHSVMDMMSVNIYECTTADSAFRKEAENRGIQM